MKAHRQFVLIVAVIMTFGCASVPRQVNERIDPDWLVGEWRSVKFDGLCAHDFASESFTFARGGVFTETTVFSGGVESSLDGTYRIDDGHIQMDDGHGYTPRVPFYLENDTLVITRRANIGRVTVTFRRRDAGDA